MERRSRVTERTNIPGSPMGMVIKSGAELRSLLSPQQYHVPRPTDEGRP
jgi:hypothetical protein